MTVMTMTVMTTFPVLTKFLTTSTTNMEPAWEKITERKFALLSDIRAPRVNGGNFALVERQGSNELIITMKWAKSDESPYIVTKFRKMEPRMKKVNYNNVSDALSKYVDSKDNGVAKCDTHRRLC